MRILIVEDDEQLSRFLEESLLTEFFAIDTARDGEQGSLLGRANDYDLIVLEAELPIKSGMQVCEEIRSSGKVMPIVIISENASTQEKVMFLDAGADDHLSKPFDLEELLARIRALVRRPFHILEDILLVEDIELNTKAGVARRGDQELQLTRKEYMLLRYLMRNEGSVLSRGMILEHVWDMSVDIFSNTIESHILSLRKKLGDTGKQRLIRTISGRGYRMSA